MEMLESNDLENRVRGKKGETDHRLNKYSPRKRRNGDTPVGYSGQIALMREQYSV
jgi:hypothetical protein